MGKTQLIPSLSWAFFHHFFKIWTLLSVEKYPKCLALQALLTTKSSKSFPLVGAMKSKRHVVPSSMGYDFIVFSSSLHYYQYKMTYLDFTQWLNWATNSLQMEGRWESNINGLLGISFAYKKLTTRVNCFHLWSIIFQIENLYVGHLCELLGQPQQWWGGQGTAANHCLAAVLCPSLCSAVELRVLSCNTGK